MKNVLWIIIFHFLILSEGMAAQGGRKRTPPTLQVSPSHSGSLVGPYAEDCSGDLVPAELGRSFCSSFLGQSFASMPTITREPSLDDSFDDACCRAAQRRASMAVKCASMGAQITGGEGRVCIEGNPQAQLHVGGAVEARAFVEAFRTTQLADRRLLVINVAEEISFRDDAPILPLTELSTSEEIQGYLEGEVPQVRYIAVPWEDSNDHAIVGDLDHLSDIIRAAHERGYIVYVHCAQGISRSVTVVIDYLMGFGEFTLKGGCSGDEFYRQAWGAVCVHRECAQPNFIFEQILGERGCFHLDRRRAQTRG